MSELASVASGAPKVTHVIARQVIVDFKRKVFGYELFDRSVAHHLHTAASDAELLFNALSHSEYQEMLTLKPLFVNCTHESLAGGHLELINPERVVLEIPALNGDHIEDIEVAAASVWLSNTGSLAPRTHPGYPLLHSSRLT